MERIVSAKSIKALVTGVLAAFGLTLAAFIAVALALTYTGLSESYVGVIVTVTSALSCVMAGFDSGKNALGRGWLWGIAAGAVYALLLIAAASFVSSDFAVNLRSLTLIAFCLAGGALGGVIGINFKKE